MLVGKVYVRGCGRLVSEDIVHDLIGKDCHLHQPLSTLVFRVIVPVSFCVTIIACIICVVVTLRVAYLEMGDGEATISNGTINAFVPSRESATIAATRDSNPLRDAPNLLSNVAGPALRTLNPATTVE